MLKNQSFHACGKWVFLVGTSRRPARRMRAQGVARISAAKTAFLAKATRRSVTSLSGRVRAIDRAFREPPRNLKFATSHNFDLTQSMQLIELPTSPCNISFVFPGHANKKRQ
jgi:hypothetical protein